ncbi:MAG TPA: CBS domain-containing protein, partial [Chroococcidiopsis sp.]
MTASPFTSIDLWSAIARDPLRVSPTTSVRDAIAQMAEAGTSYVLVVDDSSPQAGKLIGLLTERDLVPLYLQHLQHLQPTPLQQLPIQAVMR